MRSDTNQSCSLPERFRIALQQRCGVPAGSGIVAAISGGADSVALLLLLDRSRTDLRLQLKAVHIHHGIRGEEADEDAEFVRKLCGEMGIPVEVVRVSVPEARRKGESLEEAARRLRYAELARIAQQEGARFVATGHTADDLVETVIFHLARGSGPLGLTGIRPLGRIAGIDVVRPLLEFWHDELCDYLKAERRTWREDTTNRDLGQTRNRIRHELIPWLEKNINPAARRNIARLARIVADEEEWLAGIVTNVLQSSMEPEGRLSVSVLQGLPIAAQRRVLLGLLQMYGAPVSSHNVERLVALANRPDAGARIDLGEGWKAVRGSGFIRVAGPGEPEIPPYRRQLKPGSQVALPEVGLLVVSEWVTSPEGEPPAVTGRVGLYPAEVYLDGKRCLKASMVVRSWQPGDRIRPIGLSGRRKLQDIFTDEKVPQEDRARIPVLEADGEVIWVAGHRAAAGWEGRGGRMLYVRVERLA